MRLLSKQLDLLAGTLRTDQAALRRAKVQMLALSLALSPANPEARQMLRDLKSGAPVHDAIQQDTAILRGMNADLEWLQQDEAGADGHALANCLQDVMRYFQPGNGLEGATHELGQWHGWVPDLVFYQEPKAKPEAPELAKVNVSKNVRDEDSLTTKTSAEKPTDAFHLKVRSAELETPIWRKVGGGGDADWVLRPSPLDVQVSMPGADSLTGNIPPFTLKFGPTGSPVNFHAFENRLTDILTSYHGRLPAGLLLNVDSSQLDESLQSKRDLSISAPVCVLASAVISGLEPDAMVIGTVTREQKIHLGRNFWQKLLSLGPSNAERLVVSPEAKPYLEAMLVMHRMDFFFKHEVFFARDYKQLISRALKGSASRKQLSASKDFQVIREYSKGKIIRYYLANSYVKSRLEKVLGEDPNHASASMLYEQASGNRSACIDRKVVAAELLRIMEPVSKIQPIYYYQLEEGRKPPVVNGWDDQLLKQIDQLQGYTDRDDMDLIQKTEKVVDMLKGLGRAEHSRIAGYARANAISRATVEIYNGFTRLRSVLMDAGN